MKNIIGTCDIRLINEDGEIIHFDTVENDICWPMWRYLLSGFPSGADWTFPTKRDAVSEVNGSTYAWFMGWGATEVKKTALNSWYPLDGAVRVNVDTPFWTAGATFNDNDVVTFQANIAAPVGQSRTIRTLGLMIWNDTGNTTYNICNGDGVGKFTILPLNTPCIQDTNTTILLTYRLLLPPAVTSLPLGISRSVYNDIRDLLKKSCDSVASVYFGYSSSNRTILTSAYDFTNLYTNANSFGYRGTPFDSSGLLNVVGELTDAGMVQDNVTPSIYTNVMKQTATYGVSHVLSTGVFAKTLLMGGRGVAAYNYPNQIASTQLYKPVITGTINPVQNVFKQRNSPPGPFQDAATTGTMTGSITLDYTNWVDPGFQKLFKINITTTGDNTTSSYNVETMNYVGGFAGNRYVPRTSYFPQMVTSHGYIKKSNAETIYESYMNFGGTVYRSPDNYKFVAAIDCQRTAAGITIYDILAGTKTLYNSTSTSPLNVTAVSDGDVSKGYVFVTCANTGLYRINPTTNVVEHITSPTGIDKAYQICAKNDANGTIWVLFDGGLCKLNISADSATILTSDWSVHNSSSGSPTFTYVGITDNNWQSVTAMIIDPDDAGDNKFLFVRSNPSASTSNYRLAFVWWKTSTGIAANPSTSGITFSGITWNVVELLKISDAIRCIQGKWFIPAMSAASALGDVAVASYGDNSLIAYYFTYGNNSMSARVIPTVVNGVSGGMFSQSHINGHYTSSFFLPSTITTAPSATNITPASSAYIEFPLRYGANSYEASMQTSTGDLGYLGRPLVYLANSNMIFTYEVVTSFAAYGVTPLCLPPTHSKYNTYKGAFWKSYGWDGSSWVLNHVGSKTAHSSLANLPNLDGLRISFANGVSGTSFISGEWFISSIGNGLLKDNGTSYTYNLTWDLAPTEKITLSATVPSTALGALTDEPVTFSHQTPNFSSGWAGVMVRSTQKKGWLISNGYPTNASGTDNSPISDQLIPASTDFNFRFKWISYVGTANSSNYKAMGVATGTGTYTYAFYFGFNGTTGNLELVDSTSTVRATILAANLAVNKECKIERIGSTITAYYDGVSLYSITLTSQLVIMARSYNYYAETGWWDMKLSYTENRKVLRIGDLGTLTGSYSPNFSSLTSTSLVSDTVVYLGSGTPVLATLDFTTSGSAIAATGIVKVAPGAGWLVFHDSEAAIPVTGYTIAHYVLSGM